MDYLAFLSFIFVSGTSILPYNTFMNAQKIFVDKLINFQYIFYKLRNGTNGSEPIPVNSSLHPLFHAFPPSVHFYSYGESDPSDEHSEQLNELQKKFESAFTIFTGVAAILGCFLNAALTSKLSNPARVLIGHVSVFLVFIPVLLLSTIDTDNAQEFFYYSMLFLAGATSLMSQGLIGPGVLSLSALYSVAYTPAVMIGQAATGLLSSLMAIFIQWVTKDPVRNGRLFFGFGFVWTLVSVGVYLRLWRRKPSEADALIEPLIDEDGEDQGLPDESVSMQPASDISEMKTKEQWLYVYKKTWKGMWSVAVILTGTLSIFPAVASLVATTSHNDTWKYYYTQIACFMMFNVGDVIGRIAAVGMRVSQNTIFTISIARVVLIPLLILCNVEPRHLQWLSLISADGIFIVLMFCLSFTQGYLMTHSSVNIFSLVEDELKDVTGALCTVFSVLPAMTGSIIGYILVCII